MISSARSRLLALSPQRWRLAAALAIAAIAGLMLATFLDYGLTWDEEFQRTYGDHVIAWYTSGFKDRSAFHYNDLFLYGAFFDVLAQLWDRVSPLRVYEDRHLVNVAFAILGLIGTYRLGALLGGPRAGCLAAIALALTPMFYGHAFNNPKDIPFATCFVWALDALFRSARSLPRIARWQTLKLGILIGFILGIRVGGIFFFGYVGLLWAASLFMRAPARDGGIEWRALLRHALLACGALAAVVLIAWGVMLVFWPWAQVHPYAHPYLAIRSSLRFHFSHMVLFDGAFFPATAVPPTYLPVLFSLSLPELHFIAWGAGVVALALYHRAHGMDRQRSLELGMLGFAILFPIVTAIALRSTLYDNVRHFLFVVPPLAIFTGLALDALWRLPGAGRLGWFRHAALGTCALAAAVTLRDMIHLHPYESVYFNRLIAGGLPGVADRYETDYWGSSYREATEWVLANVRSDVPVRVANCSYPLLSSYFMGPEATGGRFVAVGPDQHPDILLATTRWNCHRRAGARVLHTIDRQGVPLAYVLDLRRNAGVLGVAPARAEDLPNFDRLWNFDYPKATEAKLREILPKAEASGNADYLGQLLTQIARSQGLQGRLDDAHQTLDRVEKMLTPEMKAARVRYLLERGRLFRSSKQFDKSKSQFLAAWDLGRAAGLDGYACDAAHMMGAIEGGDKAIEWDLEAIDLAERSEDPKARAWLGVLYSNTGWMFLDKGDYAKALEVFRKGLAWHTELDQPVKILIAKWRVGRALRSLGRIDEALATQREVEKGLEAVGEPHGYVFEEIGECLTAQGKPAEAKPYFAKAYALLKGKAESENLDAKRLERMKTLGGVGSK